MRISDWSSDVCSSDLFGIGGAGRVQRGILRHLTGNALIGRRAGEVETSLDVGRNPVSDIEIAAYGIPIAMVAIAVDPLRRNSGKIIERPGNAAGAGLRSEEHTYELPVTNAHLVCRLLLEKKQKQTHNPK